MQHKSVSLMRPQYCTWHHDHFTSWWALRQAPARNPPGPQHWSWAGAKRQGWCFTAKNGAFIPQRPSLYPRAIPGMDLWEARFFFFFIAPIMFALSFWITFNFAFSCYCDGCVQNARLDLCMLRTESLAEFWWTCSWINKQNITE